MSMPISLIYDRKWPFGRLHYIVTQVKSPLKQCKVNLSKLVLRFSYYKSGLALLTSKSLPNWYMSQLTWIEHLMWWTKVFIKRKYKRKKIWSKIVHEPFHYLISHVLFYDHYNDICPFFSPLFQKFKLIGIEIIFICTIYL